MSTGGADEQQEPARPDPLQATQRTPTQGDLPVRAEAHATLESANEGLRHATINAYYQTGMVVIELAPHIIAVTCLVLLGVGMELLRLTRDGLGSADNSFSAFWEAGLADTTMCCLSTLAAIVVVANAAAGAYKIVRRLLGVAG